MGKDKDRASVKCTVCMDRGKIPAGYVDWGIGVKEAKKLIPCVKCQPKKAPVLWVR